MYRLKKGRGLAWYKESGKMKMITIVVMICFRIIYDNAKKQSWESREIIVLRVSWFVGLRVEPLLGTVFEFGVHGNITNYKFASLLSALSFDGPRSPAALWPHQRTLNADLWEKIKPTKVLRYISTRVFFPIHFCSFGTTMGLNI